MDSKTRWARRAGVVAFALGYVVLGAPSCANIAGLSDLELVDELPGTGGSGTGTGGSTGTGQIGEACSTGNECELGHCVDGVCCDSACDTACVACGEELTHMPSGTCLPIPAGEDPKGQCGTTTCGGSGTCAPELAWVHVFGSNMCDDGAELVSVDERVLLTLNHQGDIDVGGGDGTALPGDGVQMNPALGQYTQDGNWLGQWGRNEVDRQLVGPIAATGGFVATCGLFRGSFDLLDDGDPMTTAPNENHMWVAGLVPENLSPTWKAQISSTSSGARCRDIAVAANGDVVVVGTIGVDPVAGGEVLPSYGASDAVVVRYGSDGSYKWAKTFGSPGSDRAGGVAIVEMFDKVVVVGEFGGDAGSVATVGSDSYELAGNGDAFVVVLNGLDGEVDDVRVFGGDGMDGFGNVTVDSANNVLVCGHVGNAADLGQGPIETLGTDAVLMKIDPLANLAWYAIFGGPDDPDDIGQRCRGVVARDDHITIAGLFPESIDLGGGPLLAASEQDIFVARLNADGSHRWSMRLVDETVRSEFRGLSLGLDPGGNVILAGELAGVTDFGSGAITARSDDTCSNGPIDVFLAKYLVP